MKYSNRKIRPLMWLSSSSELRILLIIVALCIFMSIASPYFLDVGNIMDLLEGISVTCIVAFGVTFVILVGGIDLSIGSTMGIGAMVTGLLHLHNFPILLSILLGIIAGLIVGLLNGMLIEWLGFPDLIATLSMMGILRGIIYLFIGDHPLRGYKSELYLFLGQGRLFGIIPILFIIAIFIMLIGNFFLFKSIYGRQILMVGTNRKAAMLSGINTKLLRFNMYAICGLLAGLAGVLLGGRLGGAIPQVGAGYELQAIAAVVVGGTSLLGGRGSFVGTFLGVILIGLIRNILTLLAIDPFWHLIITGIIILIAIIIDRLVSNINILEKNIKY